MFSISNWIKSETPPQVSIVATSPRIEALKTARDSVVANENGVNVTQIIPEPISAQPRKLDTTKLVGNVTLPVPQNDNIIPGISASVPSVQEIPPSVEEVVKHTPIAELPPFIEPANEVVIPTKEFVSIQEETGLDSSRVFVNTFLQDINNLLLAGKKLETILKDKEVADASFVAANSNYEMMRSKRMAVATSIAQLFGEGETSVSGENLKLVSEAYDNYLDSFNREAESLTGKARQEINKLSLKINAEKGNIKKMFEGAGGPANVEKIKSIIRTCESLGAKARGLVELPSSLKKEIAQRVAHFVANDLEGSKLLLGNPTDIVGMLVRIYTDVIPSKN